MTGQPIAPVVDHEEIEAARAAFMGEVTKTALLAATFVPGGQVAAPIRATVAAVSKPRVIAPVVERVAATAAKIVRPGAPASNVTVYRVEGAANARLTIADSGDVTIHGDAMLYLNFGDEARALEYLAQKQAQPGMTDVGLKSFEVSQSYADSLFDRAVPQRGGAEAPIQQVDITRTDRSLGLASSEFAELACAILPRSGRC
ncbi:hypothetical protein [Nocardioides sp. L-11A]|uniref:hypothetical protein n=1 Tax=Nocardioides sp. L-11A TaxID=3043848 RepID=UPI00249B8BC5|nr:hypothetical protein QJ852_18610 [Nocardioides sp. L-11A]